MSADSADRDEGRIASDALLASLEESARYGHPTPPLDRSAAADVWGEIVAGRKRITELKRALEPFAAYYGRIHSPQFGSDATIVIEVEGDIALTVGAFRRASEMMCARLPYEAQHPLRDLLMPMEERG
jgi:hypothetical protein